MGVKPLVLSMGDPAGIGPEITAKAWDALRTLPDFCFAIIAPMSVVTQTCRTLGLSAPVLVQSLSEAEDVFATGLPVLAIEGENVLTGQPDVRAAPSVIESIKLAVKLALANEASGVVTNPISKHILYQAGFEHPGHTEFLGALTQDHTVPYARGPVMMLSGGGLSVGLTTVHQPLAEAAKSLNGELIQTNARVMYEALKCDFGIERPRLAMTGLNPHAGEDGALGREEIEIINPAALALRGEGINITDAQPADTLFHAEAREGYDAVLAMYHDQGLIPVKTLDFHGGVNITLGLPIVRTSPDHGTAFGIAGQGIARPDSLIAAIETAQKIAVNRASYAG